MNPAVAGQGLDLVLASTSPYRRMLLERLGVPFRWRDPGVDESRWEREGAIPILLANELAMAKALGLSGVEPGATLIGCDQVVACGGEVFGKPGTAEGAVEQLLTLSGREHQLITALAVWHRGRTHMHTDVTTLTMRDLDRSAIERYVEADAPLDCAGSYKLEARGIVLFEEIDSEDHSAITGLPLIGLTTILRRIGYRIP